MRQVYMMTTAPLAAPADADPTDLDLFGNPIAPTHAAAPTYRPRAPKQQLLDLAPGVFVLGGGK